MTGSDPGVTGSDPGVTGSDPGVTGLDPGVTGQTGPKGKFDCDQCARKCRDNEALRRPMKLHRGEHKLCKFCCESFNSLYVMQCHQKDCHYKWELVLLKLTTLTLLKLLT